MCIRDSLTTVQNAVDSYESAVRLRTLEREINGASFEGILGDSDAMRSVYHQIDRLAASDIRVVLHGESGTGKELAAHAIHRTSGRVDGAFVSVNCAAIPDTLQDSELFGHEKGAFTGAVQMRKGKVEQADGGTLFLDEVAELSPSLQAKILRVLQERTFERVGGNQTLRSDFRLIAASHRDLKEMVEAGEFREDLYFRIAVYVLELPALRDRNGDIEVLVASRLASLRPNGAPLKITNPALDALQSYGWPGNVRELFNVLDRAAVLADDVIDLGDLAPTVLDSIKESPVLAHAHQPEVSSSDLPAPTGMTLAELEKWAILHCMKRLGGNLGAVTQELGIGRTTLYRKLKQYGIR